MLILVLVYSFIMAAVNLILIVSVFLQAADLKNYENQRSPSDSLFQVQSIQNLATYDGEDTKKFHLPSIIAVAVAFGGPDFAYKRCLAEKRPSHQIRPLSLLLRHPICFIAGASTLGGSPQRPPYVRRFQLTRPNDNLISPQEQFRHSHLRRREQTEMVD